jgi:hypothetical protein
LLGLFEGVVTGAADGYARIARRGHNRVFQPDLRHPAW